VKRHPNPLIEELIQQARNNGSSERIIDLMLPYWERNTPSLEDQVRSRFLTPTEGPPPLESSDAETRVRHRMGLPRLQGDNE